MLIFYTDIKNIPVDVYEAASIDGAGPARKFFSITLPIITPTILFNLITSIISSFQQVTLVMLLTGGDRLNLPTSMDCIHTITHSNITNLDMPVQTHG